MGIELSTEEEYRALRKLGDFDLKTSSWIATPVEAALHREIGAVERGA